MISSHAKAIGVLLEVIAEGEIAHHLEESVMALGEADVFEVVVLAAGADAFLGGCGAIVVAFFESEENILELVHAGVGEEERGIAVRDERKSCGRGDVLCSQRISGRSRGCLFPVHFRLGLSPLKSVLDSLDRGKRKLSQRRRRVDQGEGREGRCGVRTDRSGERITQRRGVAGGARRRDSEMGILGRRGDPRMVFLQGCDSKEVGS